MFYSAYAIYFFIIYHLFSIPISNANPSVDDNMLIAFVKGHHETQICEYSKQKYEAHLGIVYFMRKIWQCDKIHENFDEFERSECHKYGKYLDILYEYLNIEYVGIQTVKPKFAFTFKKKQIEINGSLNYLVNCLSNISQFYFVKWELQDFLFKIRNLNRYKLNNLFGYFGIFQPKLLNEERLNYEVKLENEQKLPINEIILALAIDTANEWQTNENLERIIRQKLEENLEKMFKRAVENAKKDNPLEANEINVDKHRIIVDFKFDDSSNWIDDLLFSEFVKGLATNFTNYYKLTKEYSSDEKENLAQKYEAHLGTLYLMRKNWHCDQIGEKFGEKFDESEWTECQKYRKCLDILYEYLFQLFIEVKSSEINKQLPSLVKPIFLLDFDLRSLIDVVSLLNSILRSFWEKGENEFCVINLVNEKELNYELKDEKSEENGEKPMNTNEMKFNDPAKIANLRREFERKMEKICEKTKENANKEKAKLEKALTNMANNQDKYDLQSQYDDKFGTFISLPFS